MNDSSTRGTWILAALLAAAAVAYVMVFFLPGARQTAAMVAQLRDKQSFILESQRSHRIFEQMQRELVETRDYNGKFREQLLTHDELPGLYRQISHVAKTHEVATVKFEPQAAVEFETFQRKSIQLGVSGSFSGIHRLAWDLEETRQQLWITEMKIRGPREAGKHVECDLTLVVFIDNPEKND